MADRKTKMQTWIDYRVRVTTNEKDRRVLVGTFLAFDKYMNMVLGETEEFRKVKHKASGEEREVKRVIGLVVLRGDTVMSMTAEAPPAHLVKSTQHTAGPGRAAVAGRGGGNALAMNKMGMGLQAPTRGVGGPNQSQMQPRGLRPPGMPQ
ncbi:unnamed protein product [Amoebophrya sp. A120]|nr:unnamed protein product [Amoebophrya sp. A120]|eukprot:GSA120T00015799001.1